MNNCIKMPSYFFAKSDIIGTTDEPDADSKLTGTEKKVLERVFDIITISEECTKETLIEKTADAFGGTL